MKLKRCVIQVLCVQAFAASTSMALAQDEPLAKTAQQVIGQARPVHVQAQIVGIDRASRSLTVTGPRGTRTVLVNKEVGNFDHLQVGDRVDVDYKNALLISAEKVKGGGEAERRRIDKTTYRPASEPQGVTGFDATRQVEVVATVEGVDAKRRTITLRGPWQTDTFDLTPDLAAEKLKKGDTVHAVFTSAAAVRVTPVGSAGPAVEPLK